MKNTKYTNPEDLLADKSFIAWYFHTNEKDVQEWNRWIAAGILNRRLAADAVYSLGRKSIENNGITDNQIKTMAKHFINSIVELQKNEDELHNVLQSALYTKI